MKPITQAPRPQKPVHPGWLASALLAGALLSACGGDDDATTPPPPPPPPPPPVTYAVTASVTGNGKLTSNVGGIDCGSSCTANVAANTVVQFTATPAAGQVLQSWGGACASTVGSSCSVTVIQATAVTATFAPQPPNQFALTVAVTGNGRVSSQPAGIDCGSTCTARYAAGTSVVLTAAPAAGHTLQSWSGACSGTAAACTVALSEARNVSASFAAAPPPAMAWGTAALLESSNDFNVADTNTFADANVLSAIDGAGNALVVWEQSDGTPNGSTRKVFSRRYTAGQGWAAAVAVPGLTSSSSTGALVSGRLLMDAAGNAIWVRNNFETRRYNAGTGWSATPFSPSNGANGELADAKIDADGNVHLLGIGGDDVRHSRLPAGSNQWSAFVDVNQSTLAARNAQLTLGKAGSLIAVWRERNPGDALYSMKATQYVNGSWQTPVRIEEVLTAVNDSAPRIASDAAGNAIVAWHQGSSLYVNRFDAATQSWGTATEVDARQVSDIFSARIVLAMLPDGRAVLAWSSGTFGVKAMSYTPGSGYSAPALVNTYSSGHSLAIDQSGRAVLVYRSVSQWPNPTEATQNLYARELPWGGAWSAATTIESGAGDIKDGLSCAANPAGQWVCAWAQNDLANSTVRNSLWSNLRR